MLQLNNLSTLVKKRKTVGRGGSRGGTSGKGGKGQTARSGGSTRPGFEGGQMPLFRRLPKRGFNNFEFAKHFEIVNIGDISTHFNDGDTVTKQALYEKGIIKLKKGLIRKQEIFVKVLGNGVLNKKLVVEADAFSASARDAIVKHGGEALVIKEN